MVEAMDKAAIIRLHQAGNSNRSIAKTLFLARGTVNKYVAHFKKEQAELETLRDQVAVAELQNTMLSKNRMDVSTRTPRKFMGALAERFYALIRADEERNEKLGPNKQQINGALLYRQLRAEGFNVGESTVRAKWRRYRQGQKEVFIKQLYEPGERADFDFHQVKLIVGGRKITYHQATISCPYSNQVFIKLCRDETQQAVLTALQEFFHYCGGVFTEITFDNLKPVVKKYGSKQTKELTAEITKFAAYYHFRVNTTNARRGNEKGHVETSGKNVRKALFAWQYAFRDEGELMAYVTQELKNFNKEKAEKFVEEQRVLRALPVHDYALAKLGTSRVNTYSLARVATNYYSVPELYVGADISYTMIHDIVVFYLGTREIARHARVEGTDSYALKFEHYERSLRQKPGALARSHVLRQASAELITLYKNKYSNNPSGFLDLLYGEQAEAGGHGGGLEAIATAQLAAINAAYCLNDEAGV